MMLDASLIVRRETMLIFFEGHPNTDVMTLYVIAAITLGILLYRFHQRQV
jgi:hypothetical protein